MKKIIKSGGWCSDGCQWQFCDFYITEPIKCPVTDEHSIEMGHRHYCSFFGNQELYHGSLHCCNKIYGMNYEGEYELL